MKKLLIVSILLVAGTAFADHHDTAFKECDANSDGKVTKQEFLTKKEKAFEKADKNSDGALSESEHAEMLQNWKEKKAK